MLFWGLTLGILGKVLLGYAVINVHSHVIKEKHIDRDVIRAMKRERSTAALGVFLLVIGYFLELSHFGYITF